MVSLFHDISQAAITTGHASVPRWVQVYEDSGVSQGTSIAPSNSACHFNRWDLTDELGSWSLWLEIVNQREEMHTWSCLFSLPFKRPGSKPRLGCSTSEVYLLVYNLCTLTDDLQGTPTGRLAQRTRLVYIITLLEFACVSDFLLHSLTTEQQWTLDEV